MSTVSVPVDNRRVATLLRKAVGLFGAKGRSWIKGDLKQEIDYKGDTVLYGYCAAGAIREVAATEGFTDAERVAAERTLAELIIKSKGMTVRDYTDGYTSTLDQSTVEEIIFSTNDDEYTTFEDVKGFFSRTVSWLKGR